ncbi:hypothetical protein GQF03_05795 [Sneathiella chungangensis]|uniref:Uncharacterized protein n=1 Tax=Sneathiella chungangensis TaxID=1418234 RepID=A0A845MF16_9PROT|nr:hypothetical protein [Sneathiella chungangensis]MZR21837.1 hypothetical protein [Sneathiella chungangensis]
MTAEKPGNPTQKERQKAEKAERLATALRENLRKRKDLQRNRGEAAPAAIKNRNKLTD